MRLWPPGSLDFNRPALGLSDGSHLKPTQQLISRLILPPPRRFTIGVNKGLQCKKQITIRIKHQITVWCTLTKVILLGQR